MEYDPNKQFIYDYISDLEDNRLKELKLKQK